MEKLFVDKIVEINASAAKVWDVLTTSRYTDEWAPEFSGGGPRLHIESEWELESTVHWKEQNGTVIVEGTVTALELNKLLRYTVFDVRSLDRVTVTVEDGITFQLFEKNGLTTLHILHGDFSAMTDGEKYRDSSAVIWDKVLVKIKAMAETN
jgi:uncharacterized protein YndB with AHSA1/START domain